MSLRYGYFDSEITGYDSDGMPIFDRAESSDFLAMFISKIISDGVLALPGDCFQVLESEGMNIIVRPGFGIVKGRFAYDSQEYVLQVPTAPLSYKRIDRVILRANYLQRKCEIIIKQGTVNATPEPPELTRPSSGDYYELCLATISVNSNQTAITQANITDTRYDSDVCGVVTQAIDHLDTSVFFEQLNKFYEEFVARSDTSYEDFLKQMQDYEALVQNEFQTWFSHIKNQLSEDAAGNLQNQIDSIQSRITELLNTYDPDGDGKVVSAETADNALMFGDQLPEYYAKADMVTKKYDPNAAYTKGQTCIQNDKIWRAKADIKAPEAWTEGHWEETSLEQIRAEMAAEISKANSDISKASSDISALNANLKTFVGIAFFEPTNTGIQRVDVVFEHQLKSDPVAVIAIYNDTISVADFMGPLNIVIDSITKTGFSVSAKRLQSEYRWMIKYIVYY